MEKLIVKNFGPIKEAEIDLTKFIVFIGDTSTGKSVLAKLISIFRDSLYSTHFLFTPNEKIKVSNVVMYDLKDQLKKLNIDFDYDQSYIYYQNDTFSIEFSDGGDYAVSGNFFESNVFDSMFDESDDIIIRDIDLESGNKSGHNISGYKAGYRLIRQKKPSYFPAERILISIVGSSIAGLWANNVALPTYFKEFAAKFEKARILQKKVDYRKFGFKYSYENNNDMIQMGKNQKFDLTKMSSGIQSLVPMLLTFDHEVSLDHRTLVVEEPELNLFPVKQKILIEYLIGRINETGNRIVVTTHSPYTLSCLNTLILAKNVYNEKPEYKERIKKIVPENIWIDYGDISVYEVKKGKVSLLKNDEFKSIETNIIDEVSGVISSEFDELLDLRYE